LLAVLKDKLLQTVKSRRLISQGDRVLVGISGGPDSTALLHALFNLRSALGISLCAAHLNHMIRGKSALLDEKFVASFCRKLRVPLKIKRADVMAIAKEKKLSLEDAGRRARYKFFEEAASEFKAAKIAMGHTADDSVETVLMRLITGAGAKGLVGIPAKRGKIVRPLIDCTRKEIERYCGQNHLAPRVDESNRDVKFLRNRIRHELIPLLEKFNPRVRSAIKRTSDLLGDELEYITEISAGALSKATVLKTSGKLILDVGRLKAYPDPIKRHMLRLAIESIKGDLENITYSHIAEILSKLSVKGRFELHLPSSTIVSGERNRLTITSSALKPLKEVRFCRKLKVPGVTHINEAGISISVETIKRRSGLNLKLKDSNVALLDFDKLKGMLVVRSRRDGDRFSPLGISGTKKLKDFLIDEKVPNEKKDLIPIVSSKGRIVWVGGHRINEAFKITKATRTALRLVLVEA